YNNGESPRESPTRRGRVLEFVTSEESPVRTVVRQTGMSAPPRWVVGQTFLSARQPAFVPRMLYPRTSRRWAPHCSRVPGNCGPGATLVGGSITRCGDRPEDL